MVPSPSSFRWLLKFGASGSERWGGAQGQRASPGLRPQGPIPLEPLRPAPKGRPRLGREGEQGWAGVGTALAAMDSCRGLGATGRVGTSVGRTVPHPLSPLGTTMAASDRGWGSRTPWSGRDGRSGPECSEGSGPRHGRSRPPPWSRTRPSSGPSASSA